MKVSIRWLRSPRRFSVKVPLTISLTINVTHHAGHVEPNQTLVRINITGSSRKNSLSYRTKRQRVLHQSLEEVRSRVFRFERAVEMENAREVVITSDSSEQGYSAAVWDPLTGSRLSTYRNAAPLGNRTLRIVGDSYVLAADATKPRLYLWPLNGQSPVANLRLTTPGKVSALACTPDGSYTVVAIGEKIFVWQLTTGKLLGTVARHYQTVTCLEFGQDGSNFASGGEEGLVFVWSLTRIANGHEQSVPLHCFSDHALAVKDLHYGSFGAQARLISVSLDRTARLYDSNSGTPLFTLVFDDALTAVCTDIREAALFVGSSNGLIIQFDLRDPPRDTEYHVPIRSTSEISGNPVFRGHTESVTALSVFPDCKILLSGSVDGAVHFWDIRSQQIVRTITHKGPITSACFTPAYHNYYAATLNAKLEVRPLQRISDESCKDDVIEIVSPCDDSHLLDFESYLEDNAKFDRNDSDASRNLVEARAEIESLKLKNAEMYAYAIKVLSSKAAAGKSK